MNDELAPVRKEIDEIDGQLTALLKKRMLCSAKVADIKQNAGLPICVPKREKALLEHIEALSGERFAPYIGRIYRDILSESREYQRKRMRCGLVGEKLPYSFSPQIHALLAGYEYELFELKPDEMRRFFSAAEFHGVNVTIPYKKAAMAFCDELTEAAEHVGCVNTVLRRDDGTLLGHNTDYAGFAWLLDNSGIDIRGKKAIVLGTGGASMTVQAVLHDRGVRELIVVSRSGNINYENIYEHSDAVLLVNATPAGTYPNNGECLVDLKLLQGLECVLDVVYNPSKTALLLQAEELGLRHSNGLGMLVVQAVAASELFTGRSYDPETIRAVISRIERQEKNILLVGMPGSGKSSVGRAVAEMMGRKFYDTDEMIEKKAGLSIPEIFSVFGEDHFRALEHSVLEDVTKRSGAVIATGGGAVTKEKNIRLLRQNSTVVWLKRELSLLPCDGRPLSEASSLNEMYGKRKQMYQRAADISIENDCRSPKETAEKLIGVVMG